jgi:AcrR family transcriptional regulator
MHKTYQNSAQTRQRIVERAVELFNEHGTQDVSTNHIAAAASLSPGNLYYHFRNKEEIIRSILEMIIADWDALYQPLDLEQFDLGALRQLVQASFELNWKYRFFYRELVSLLRKDEQLQARYNAIQQQRFDQQAELVARLAQLKRIRLPKERDEVRNALRIAWIVQDGWILHQEMLGHRVDEHTLEEGVELVMYVYRPYFVTKVKGR